MPRVPIRNLFERRLAAGVCAILILAAELLFGGVDPIVQVGLVFGLALGFMIFPPEIPRISGPVAWLGVGLAVFVAVSQFLPHHLFGDTKWYSLMSHDYELAFPFTRNPEPGRAVDCLLMGLLAVGWFYWVRTLACDRPVQVFLIWALFAAAATVAIVSLSLGTRTDYMIYGYRYTPGWTGFGPFPNRNHTAALLAMGALAGGGCLVRAARRRYWVQLGLSLILEVSVIIALLESKSRGGLLGFCCGAALFAVLAISKLRSRSAIAGSLAGGLLGATLVLSFGTKVLSRFSGSGDGQISNNLRWQIWQDAVRVWRDAPLFGHGLGVFAAIFPFYQTAQAPEMTILHPESSWLLWLDEMGAIPVVIGAALLLYFIARHALDAVRTGDRGFFLRAGAFAGVFGLLCHGLWDVPIHRWGTAAFAVALLAIGCPPLHRRYQIQLSRLWALVPIAIGAFWALPFFGDAPVWSPVAATRLLEQLPHSPTLATLDDLHKMERYFPLDSNLHQQTGIRELVVAGKQEEAWREFRIADRLTPATWTLPTMQAWLSRDLSSGMSFHFWSLAIERAGRRAPEIFLAAYHNSVDLQGGAEFWRAYADGHPELLLPYAQSITNDDLARAAYQNWWKTRGSAVAVLEPWETPIFYFSIRKWGDRAQLESWMKLHPELAQADYPTWAQILHDWRLDADAWAVFSKQIQEPEYPAAGNDMTIEALEAAWRSNPDDPIGAQAYARQCALTGNTQRCNEVIMGIASAKSAPRWFVEKAAFISAGKKDYTTAVNSMLRLSSEGEEDGQNGQDGTDGKGGQGVKDGNGRQNAQSSQGASNS